MLYLLTIYINGVELKGLKKFPWMKNLHGILYGTKWTMFRGLTNRTFGPIQER